MAIKRCLTNLLSLLITLQLSMAYMPEAQAQSTTSSAAVNSCANISDPVTQKKCYVDAGQAGLADAQSKGQVAGEQKVSGNMLSMILTLGGLAAGVAYLTTAGPSRCGPLTTSAIIMSVSSVAAFMGEIMAAETYKSKMKAANEALTKINAASADTTRSGTSSEVVNATNTQQEAFNALIKKEEAVIAAADTKKKLYMLATVGYAAAAAMAGVEVAASFLPPDGPLKTSCSAVQMKPGPYQDLTPASLYVDNYFLNDQRVPFKTYIDRHVLASTFNLASYQASVLEMNLLQNGHHSSLRLGDYEKIVGDAQGLEELDREWPAVKALLASAGNAVVPNAHASAIMGMAALGVTALVAAKVTAVAVGLRTLYTNPVARLAMSVVLTANAAFSMSAAGKEAGKAKERKVLLEKMRDQVAQSGAGINCASASSSQASPGCKATSEVLSGLDSGGANSGLAPAAYGTAPDENSYLNSPKCVTADGAFDANCGCKATNTCLKLATGAGMNAPAGLGIGETLSNLDKVTSGGIAAGSISDASLNAAAARLQKVSSALAAKNPSIKKAQDEAKKQAADFTNKIESQVSSGGAVLASKGGAGGSDLSDAKTPEEVLEKLKADISQEIGKVENKESAEAPKSNLDLSGLGAEDEAKDEGEAKLAEVMKSEFETGNNDINTNSSTNIFDIVSNRYQRSGIRRLFGIEKTIPAEQAAPTEINK